MNQVPKPTWWLWKRLSPESRRLVAWSQVAIGLGVIGFGLIVAVAGQAKSALPFCAIGIAMLAEGAWLSRYSDGS